MKARQIKGRIKAVKKTQQITKTMEMVATARIKRAQIKIEGARPYALKMVDLMESVTPAVEGVQHPLLEKREANNVLVVGFTSNRGLCGAFNSNIIRRTEGLIARESNLGRKIKLAILGKKGLSYFKFKSINVDRYFEISDRGEYSESKAVSEYIIEQFSAAQIDAAYLVFNHFKSLMRQIPTEFRLLPFEPQEGREKKGETVESEYIWDPHPEEVLYKLLPTYVETLVFRALLESIASEHAARRAAMKNATDNAFEMIKTLTLRLNKARQSQITQELTEIVTCAEAIKYTEGR